MSELKYYKLFHRASATTSPQFISVVEFGNGDEVYLKSEADKVIEEKDKEIQRLENLCESYRIDCDNLAIREANACKEIERDNKQIRHQKYKRCLDKAKYWVAVSYQCVDDKHRQRAEKHHYEWLGLAEKFKEAR